MSVSILLLEKLDEVSVADKALLVAHENIGLGMKEVAPAPRHVFVITLRAFIPCAAANVPNLSPFLMIMKQRFHVLSAVTEN